MYLSNWTFFSGEHCVPLAFCLFYEGAVDMQIWAFLTKSQCTLWILCWQLRHMELLLKKKCKNINFTKLLIYFQTTNVLESATSRRNIVTIRDSSASVEIKLWGQQIDVLNFQVKQYYLHAWLLMSMVQRPALIPTCQQLWRYSKISIIDSFCPYLTSWTRMSILFIII